MPFLNEVAEFINDSLQKGSLNKAALQPAIFNGLSSQLVRKKLVADKKAPIEIVPAIIGAGIEKVITPDSKVAVQVYHKQTANVYAYEKKSHGNGHQIRQVSDLSMVVLTNSKLTKVPKEALEPLFIVGWPQHLTETVRAGLKLMQCLIKPVGSNMDHIQVFRQEYPQSDYFLTEHSSMFLIKYRVELLFDQSCVPDCLC